MQNKPNTSTWDEIMKALSLWSGPAGVNPLPVPGQRKQTEQKKREPWVKPAEPKKEIDRGTFKKFMDFLFGQEALRKAAEQAPQQGSPRSAMPMPEEMGMPRQMGGGGMNPGGPFGGGPFGGSGGANPIFDALRGGAFARPGGIFGRQPGA